MKIKLNDYALERGQVIPIVVLVLFVLIGMAALITDGGSLLLNRRAAQNAADAGALAGAQVFCNQATYNWNEIDTAIKKYTIDENNATWYEWGAPVTDNVGVDGLVKGEIVVNVEVENDSFFAKLFNEDTLTATATAGAGCFPYGPSVVLPIAFPCNPPVIDAEPGVSVVSEECDYSMLNWEYFDSIATGTCGMSSNPLLEGVDLTDGEASCINDYLFDNHGDLIYIIVDNAVICAKDPNNYDPNAETLCELFEDGHYNLSGSERGWLNLGGQPSAADMVDWINGINTPPVSIHRWFSFIGGVKESVYSALDDRRFDIVWIPVYNYVCNSSPDLKTAAECYDPAHYDPTVGVPGPGETFTGNCSVVEGYDNNDHAHVVAFAPFFVTCVRSNDQDNQAPYEFACDGFQAAFDANPNTLAGSKSSLEGYFIDPKYLDNTEQLSPDSADLGIYVVSLTR